MSAIQKATATSAVNRVGRAHQMTQALDLQYYCYKIAIQGKLRADRLASLVRSWCAVTECIRVIRGIPSPGQLRPDLDPAQAMKALKRIRERLPIDIAGQKSGIVDEPGQAKVAKSTKGGRPTAKDKPLQTPTAESPTSGLTTLPESPLHNPPIETAVDGSPLDLPDDEPAD